MAQEPFSPKKIRMSFKKYSGRIFAFLGATACLWVGFKIVPDEPALRTLGLFLYFYVCIELATQYFISKKHREERDKTEKRGDDRVADEK